MRGGLPAGVRLLLLPHNPDVSGTDHQGMVLDPPTLQPRRSGKPTSLSGRSLVPLLALPSHPITSPRRRDTLPAHRIAGSQPLTAESLNMNRPCVFALVVIVNVIESSSCNKEHLSSRRGSLGWEEARAVWWFKMWLGISVYRYFLRSLYLCGDKEMMGLLQKGTLTSI